MPGLYDRLKAKEADDAARRQTPLPGAGPAVPARPENSAATRAALTAALRLPQPPAAPSLRPQLEAEPGPVLRTTTPGTATATSPAVVPAPPVRPVSRPPAPPTTPSPAHPTNPPKHPIAPGAQVPARKSLPNQPHRPQRVPIDAALRMKVQDRLAENVEAATLTSADALAGQRRSILARIEAVLAEDGSIAPLDRDDAARALYNDLMGFGSVQDLLDDESVSEIMVNGPGQVYVERKGCLELTDIAFSDNGQVMRLIERIVAPLGRRIDESSPMVDARLPDGSRVNAIISPLALKGPSITIRKFAKKPITVEDLVGFGTLTPGMAEFLQACVAGRLNVVVSGGTGSGKTTTLNVLSSFIPRDERIVTIEDAAELQLRQDHVVSLETRPPNVEGKGEISIRHLVKNSLRMRPDRIVVGECRGGEALDMLQAMNTGHDGSLTTAHANSPRDLVSRLETMVLMAGMELPLRAIREQIASALDLIVQCSRLKDGTRRVTHITEVQGMEGDVVVLQDLFVLRQEGMTPEGKMVVRHTPTGIRPMFMEKLANAGVQVSLEAFFSEGEGIEGWSGR